MTKDTLIIGGAILIVGIVALAILLTQQAGELNQLRYQYNALAASTVSRDELQATIVGLTSSFRSELDKRDVALYTLKSQLNDLHGQIEQAVAQASQKILNAIDARFNAQGSYTPPSYYTGPSGYPTTPTPASNVYVNAYSGYGTSVSVSYDCIRLTLANGAEIAACSNR